MVALDYLGRRWALRVGWELRDGALPFRELQRRCTMASPNVLAARLREAESFGTVTRTADGSYALTPPGRALARILAELDAWAKKNVSVRDPGTSGWK
jgi:DNA-binding HxlR family transcriptional regulator